MKQSRFSWFRRNARPSVNGEQHDAEASAAAALAEMTAPPGENGADAPIDAATALAAPAPIEHRSAFLRPWARRDAAIENLQAGVGALTDLMSGIRDHLERQSQRQDEMLGYLSALPEVLRTLPEGNRVQAEALRAIHQQMERQTQHQTQLAGVLEKISQADGRNARTLDALQDHVNSMHQHDAAISRSLGGVGEAMASMSMNAEVSASVLKHLRDNIAVRDNDFEKVLNRQGNRFSMLLSVAIFLSIAALAVAGVVGYFGLEALKHVK
jgi:hypothetical protein